MHYRGPRRTRERLGTESLFKEKKMAEKFPNLEKETEIQIQEAQSSK